jgi:hypothetical protein
MDKGVLVRAVLNYASNCGVEEGDVAKQFFDGDAWANFPEQLGHSNAKVIHPGHANILSLMIGEQVQI